MKILTITITAFFMFLYGFSLQAQSTISAGGGDASGAGGTVSGSIGQVFYKTNIDIATGSVAEGVQQPYEISVITEVADAVELLLEVKTYPNPADDFLILNINGDIKTQCVAFLYDINGIPLIMKEIKENETLIPMAGIIPGIYFLKVTCDNKEIKTFKIIKY